MRLKHTACTRRPKSIMIASRDRTQGLTAAAEASFSALHTQKDLEP
jgi:hypothetical protein